MRISGATGIRDLEAKAREHIAAAERDLERRALSAVRRGGIKAKDEFRQQGQEVGLGRLMYAITDKPDKVVHRRANGFSASSAIYVRSGSRRTRGAIESYTVGAEIVPVRSRWLWFPTPEIQRLAGAGSKRERVTPGNWQKFGLDRKIGPLVPVKSVNGNPLLVVKNVGVSALGVPGKAQSLTKRGQARRGQIAKTFLVAFIAIPRTARTSRIDVAATIASITAELQAMFNEGSA